MSARSTRGYQYSSFLPFCPVSRSLTRPLYRQSCRLDILSYRACGLLQVRCIGSHVVGTFYTCCPVWPVLTNLLYRQLCRLYILFCRAAGLQICCIGSHVVCTFCCVWPMLTDLLYRQSCRLYILFCLANSYESVVSAVMSSVHSVLSGEHFKSVVSAVMSSVHSVMSGLWLTDLCIGSHVISGLHASCL